MTDSYKPEGVLIDTPENRELTSSLASLEYAMNTGTILEGRAALCDSSHALVVELGAYRGIIPRTEGAVGIAEGQVRDIALISRVNKPVCFVVKRIETSADGSKTAFLSRREAQLKCSEEYVSQLACGDIIFSAAYSDAVLTGEPVRCRRNIIASAGYDQIIL